MTYHNRSLVRENRKVALFSDSELEEIKAAEPNLPAQVATLMRDLLLAKVRTVNAIAARDNSNVYPEKEFTRRRQSDFPMYCLSA